MSTDCAPLALTRKNEYFIPEDGIAREVIEEDITRYLGNDATVQVGIQENPQTNQIQKGYYIDAYRNLTQAMLEDLKTDSEIWEAERLHPTHVADYYFGKHCSESDYYSTDPSPACYPTTVSTTSEWHVPRDIYEAHCTQLDEYSIPRTSEDSHEAQSEENYKFATSMTAMPEFEPPITAPECIPWNTHNISYNEPCTTSPRSCENTAYEPRRPFPSSDSYEDLAPISGDRQYHSVPNPSPLAHPGAGSTLPMSAHPNAMGCNLECCDIPKTIDPSGKHISRSIYPRQQPFCQPLAELLFDDRYIETLNTNNPVPSIETSTTGFYEATPSPHSLSPVSCEFPASPCGKYSQDKSMNVNLTQTMSSTHTFRETQKEGAALIPPPPRALWLPERDHSYTLSSTKQHAYVHNQGADPTSLDDQDTTVIQNTTTVAPPSPQLEQFAPQTATWADLPLVPYVPPAKKDMPVLLNGRYIRVHADSWISSSIINADFAKTIGATINFGAFCRPLKLPTRNDCIRPVGVASISIKFPQEHGKGRMMEFIVIENFVHQAVIGGPLLHNLDDIGKHLVERPSRVGDLPICAVLGQGSQKVKCLIGDQEIAATADTGSEVNLMSLDFATRNGFDMDAITPAEADGHIRFLNGSVQSVNSVVSLPVSFGIGAPPSRLLTLVGSSLSLVPRVRRTVDYHFGLPNVGCNVSILVDFLVLEGLTVDVILGQDVHSTAREFSGISPDVFDGNGAANAVSRGVSPVEAVANSKSGDTKAQNHQSEESVSKQDLDEIARYEKQRERARKLQSREKRRAERSNEKKRRDYNKKRAEMGGNPGPNTLHYHLCPCKLHSLDEK